MKYRKRPVVEGKNLVILRECLELLNAIETIEYHNKNWLPNFAIKNPASLNREKRAILERAINIVGHSSLHINEAEQRGIEL